MGTSRNEHIILPSIRWPWKSIISFLKETGHSIWKTILKDSKFYKFSAICHKFSYKLIIFDLKKFCDTNNIYRDNTSMKLRKQLRSPGFLLEKQIKKWSHLPRLKIEEIPTKRESHLDAYNQEQHSSKSVTEHSLWCKPLWTGYRMKPNPRERRELGLTSNKGEIVSN